ncbi:hypothetical protein RI054_01g00580 [Pseudoscourfieldia marina]
MNVSEDEGNLDYDSSTDDGYSSDDEQEDAVEHEVNEVVTKCPAATTSSAAPTLKRGEVFASKEEAHNAVTTYSTSLGKKLVQNTSSSNARAVYFICKDAIDAKATAEARSMAKGSAMKKQVLKPCACPGGAVIRRVNTSEVWRVASLTDHSNCGGQLQLTAAQIAEVVRVNVTSNRGISAEELGTLVHRTIRTHYHRAPACSIEHETSYSIS